MVFLLHVDRYASFNLLSFKCILKGHFNSRRGMFVQFKQNILEAETN
jgi:hypothetical protein